jgi:probable HAF family extracellular repeat protein
MIPLGLLSGGTFSQAGAISADGTVVVGFADTSAAPNKTVAFRWTSAGGVQPMDPSNPGVSDEEHLATNANGSAVVGELNGGAAFLWKPTLGVKDLYTYLPTLGLDLTGWSLGGATGISDDGNTIVGNGLFQGVERGWIVTIPSPGSSIAFAFGALAIGRRRPARG